MTLIGVKAGLDMPGWVGGGLEKARSLEKRGVSQRGDRAPGSRRLKRSAHQARRAEGRPPGAGRARACGWADGTHGVPQVPRDVQILGVLATPLGCENEGDPGCWPGRQGRGQELWGQGATRQHRAEGGLWGSGLGRERSLQRGLGMICQKAPWGRLSCRPLSWTYDTSAAYISTGRRPGRSRSEQVFSGPWGPVQFKQKGPAQG